MSSYQKPPQKMEEDDEDIELLRMAALKTLKPNNKIEVIEVPIYQSQPNPQPLPNPIPYVRHPPPQQQMPPNYVPPGMPPIQHSIDPYIPVTINPHWDENVPKFYGGRPPLINMPPGPPAVVKPHVQLSPRSAAFVMKNNSILEKRKKSPRNYARSPNYRSSPPGRWSESPPPYRNKYATRRSISRSPSPNRNRSLSRSPPPTRSRYNSRSPPPPKREKITRKSRSRSPPPRYNVRRSRSPSPAVINNKLAKNTRSFSPIRKSPPQGNRRPYQSYNGKWEGRNRRSPSPSRQVNQRSNSPLPKKKSRSPINRGINSRNNNNLRFSKNGRYQSNPSSRAASPRYTQGKRIKSRSKSRSKTPILSRKVEEEKQHKEHKAKEIVIETPSDVGPTEETKQDNSVKDILQLLNNDEHEIKLLDEEDFDFGMDIKEPSSSSKEEIEESSTPPIISLRTKTEEELEDELLASENDNTEDELDLGDEIDLFASEESESENEGRFKSSSKIVQSKPDKPTPLSFTKLGQSSTLNSSRARSSSRERNRRRDNNKRSDSRNERRRDYSSSSSRNKISLSSKVDIKSESSKNKDDGKSMFKSTFKAVESDSNKKPIEPPRIDYPKQKFEEKVEKKSALPLKRTPVTTLITKGDPVLKSTITFENTPSVASSIQGPNSLSSASSSQSTGKKAIHLRLGPSTKSTSSSSTPTTTSWKNKKSWRQEKV